MIDRLLLSVKFKNEHLIFFRRFESKPNLATLTQFKEPTDVGSRACFVLQVTRANWVEDGEAVHLLGD